MKIHHLSIVTRNFKKSREFIIKVLKMTRHRRQSGWFVSRDGAYQLHVIEISEARSNLKDMHHYYRHIAFEVPRLEPVVKAAQALKLKTFQMDVKGEEQEIASDAAPNLDFGLKTVFVRDLDGNLWEFVQRRRSWNALFGSNGRPSK